MKCVTSVLLTQRDLLVSAGSLPALSSGEDCSPDTAGSKTTCDKPTSGSFQTQPENPQRDLDLDKHAGLLVPESPRDWGHAPGSAGAGTGARGSSCFWGKGRAKTDF